MASSDVELEKQLKETGKQLSHPSVSVDELLSVLDQVEKLLLKVEQSPKKSMLDALKPSMKALIKDDLLKHSDIDVKVSVASCISEITRITAPDTPYDDDHMRDVFQLIVSSFEHLADQSSRSYNKRAWILDTVSKVRSCVIMLDLECDGLIIEMFEHFLSSVRDYHPDSVYSSMETIMVLVLEESEEISADMLKPLLASVEKDRSGVLPVARKLGEGVILKSAAKLKPYLIPAMTSLGESLDTYTKVVASVCEGTTATLEHDDEVEVENDSGLQPVSESKLEKGSVDEAQQDDESKLTTATSDHTEQVVKNGENGEVSVDQESPKKPEEDKSQQPLNKEDTDDSDADKLAKTESQTEQILDKIGNETDKLLNSAESSDSSHVEGDKEIEKDNDIKESENEKDNDVKKSENEAVIPSEIEKDRDVVHFSSPKAIETKLDETVSSSKSGTPSDETPLKKVGPAKNKGLTLTLTKEDKLEETDNLDKKTEKRAEKKAAVAKESEDREASSNSDERILRRSKSTKKLGKKSKQSGKKVDAKVEESASDAKLLKLSAKKSNSKKDDEKKRVNGKNITEKDQAKSLSGVDEMDSSLKSTKREGNSKETLSTSAKRKRTTDKDKVNLNTDKDKVSGILKYDESLVGTKVKIWWPEDKKYYKGVVDAFYSDKKKHKVSYVDGDEEILNLRTQLFDILEEFSARNEEPTVEAQIEEASSEIHPNKKSKTDSAPSASKEKIKDSTKRVSGVSSSAKAKGSGAKSISLKTSGKSTEAAAAVSKEAGKSKEDEETPKSKTVNKSKRKNPQSGSKSNANGPTNSKSGSSNVKESEDVKTLESGKEKSTETATGGSKSGKKRRKKN